MVLFLLLSSPLAVVAAGLLLGQRVDGSGDSYSGRTYMLVRYSVLPGIFLFVAMYLLVFTVRWIVPYRYTPQGLYLYHMITDFAFWAGATTAGAIFLDRNLRAYASRDRFYVQLLFSGMVLGLLSAMDLVIHDGFWTTYQLVILPLARSGMVVIIPVTLALFRERPRTPEGQWHLAFLPLYVLCWGAVAMWSEWLRPIPAGIGSIVIIVLSALFIYASLLDGFRRTRGLPAGSAIAE